MVQDEGRIGVVVADLLGRRVEWLPAGVEKIEPDEFLGGEFIRNTHSGRKKRAR